MKASNGSAKTLITISRLRRTSEQLLKSQELADKSLSQTGGDSNITTEESIRIADASRQIGELRVSLAKLANDLQQRLSESKQERESNRLLTKDLGARPC